ncbi:5,6-dimethylbenzimidazole synthase [Chloracidobacterium thermophilum]|uniref:5,6-dimethylbenzimidazole synthase n=1 Tax=Chloracidobacterium thermophilum TaxID=458033 RepID=UPI00073886E3|nr:5,6-dimethylbenzimidazole synthase [Chloracidobacterium thermophilum]
MTDWMFSEAERTAVYRAIHTRRDIRSTFLPQPIPDTILWRLLGAAAAAPSVGFMQPTEIIVIRDAEARRQIHAHFESVNRAAAEVYTDADRHAYDALKLAAIIETPLNLCFTCDTTTRRGRGLGRQTMPETAVFSTVCAVQNVWLAARAENIGVGWVSILEPEMVKTLLDIPAHLTLVAYLCVGYVSDFPAQPELETKGWEHARDLTEMVYFDRYGVRQP